MQGFTDWLNSIRVEHDYGDGIVPDHRVAEPTALFWIVYLGAGCLTAAIAALWVL